MDSIFQLLLQNTGKHWNKGRYGHEMCLFMVYSNKIVLENICSRKAFKFLEHSSFDEEKKSDKKSRKVWISVYTNG